MNQTTTTGASRASLAALPLALLCAASGSAMAQSSSVTMNVIADAAMRYSTNSVGNLKTLVSGGNSTSRLILRGTEDLGDGLKAGFWLEGTLFTDTGTAGGTAIAPAGQFWDRQATVQLSNRLGEVRLGRDWNPVFLGYVFSDPFVFLGVGSMGNFFNASVSTVFQRAFGSAIAPSTISRSSNSIEYFLPGGLGGVNGQLMVSAGEGNNAGGSFKYRAGRLGYRAGPIDGSVYYGATQIDATGSDLKQSGIAGSYDFGVAKVSASYLNSSYLSAKQVNWLLGLSVPVGPTGFIKASYNKADQKGTTAAGVSVDADDAQQFAIGYQYYLSKNTTLYTTVARLKNSGVAKFAIPNGPAGIAGGSSSTGFDIGMRSAF